MASTETDETGVESKGVNWFARIISTGAGTGYSPIVSGTVGSMLGLPIYFVLSHLNIGLYLLTLAAFVALGIWAAEITSREVGGKEPGVIVIDEILGYLVALAGHPATAPYLVGGFILFRIFDIIKFPPPIKRLEKLPGGRGIVADDLMAGLYANILLIVVTKIY